MGSKGSTNCWFSRLAHGAAMLLAWAAFAAAAAPAAAQVSGNLRYLRGYDLVPNPPLTGRATRLVLYGVFPTGCGAVDEASVADSAHVAIRVRSAATCPDSASGSWA